MIGRDPGLRALRRAARVVIVAPTVFAVLLNVVGSPEAALFGAFGAFSCLAFADFGGDAWPRARAYLALTALGAGLVALGTVLSVHPWAAAAVMALVAFTIRFAGFFGGYWNAAVSPAILAYVLAATVPGTVGDLWPRLGGWVLAGTAVTVAALVLWPYRGRRVVRAAAGDACAALAGLVDELGAPAGAGGARASASRGLAHLREVADAPRLPAGPAAHDCALAFLVDQLDRIGTLVEQRPPFESPEAPERERATTRFAGDVLRRAGEALRGGGVAPDPAALAGERERLRDELAGVAEGAARAGDASGALRVLDETFVARAVAYLAVSVATNAAILVDGAGPTVEGSSLPIEAPEGGRTLERLRRLVRIQGDVTSPWLQDSLRAATALGAAVLVADLSAADHAFWIVLGTLSVLRSNAFATGRSALEAALGTAIGFAVSAAALALVGLDRPALWGLAIAGFFLAAYLPQVAGFLVGQAAFTLFVVALFNLLVPEGWRTGLVRVEDILIGVCVSVVVALTFWPRRAAGLLRRAIASLFRALAADLEVTTDGGAATPAAELRAHAAYVQYVEETGADPTTGRPFSALLGLAAAARVGTELIDHDRLYSGDDAGLAALEPTTRELAGSWSELADALDAARPVARPIASWQAAAAATRAPVVARLETRSREGSFSGAVGVAFAREWLVLLLRLLGRAADAIDEISRAAPGSTQRAVSAAPPPPR